jgi:hypothetical protein
MKQFEYEEEAKTLEAKIKQIEERVAEEQEAFRRLLQEEQEKIDAKNQDTEAE